LLPLLVYLFAFACNDVSGCPAPSLLHPSTLTLNKLKEQVAWPGISGLGSWKATWAVLGYNALTLVLYRVMPADEVEGIVLSSGTRLKYRLNALSCNTAVLAFLAAGTVAQGADFAVWTFIDENYIQLITANLLLSYAVATWVYVRSFSIRPGGDNGGRELAPGGLSGNMLYDWFIGRELNPRVTLPLIGEVDLKEFLELRPGMLGWTVLNCAWCAKQFRTYGYVTDSILAITAVQTLYVVDSWWNENAILTTIDITTDGFGMMLSFADFVWEPFAFTLQARYLSMHPVALGPVGLAATAGLGCLGFYIFRSANSQKNAFRTDPSHPSVSHLDYMETSKGTKLLTSGWWGVARHVNYLGDWIQAWAYCLPTGLSGYQILGAGTVAEDALVMKDGRVVVQGDARGWAVPITYFYVIYFAVLLLHREQRDDHKCQRKYGEDWTKYKRVVRWKIIPGVY
jgi:delta14-sterol reductase